MTTPPLTLFPDDALDPLNPQRPSRPAPSGPSLFPGLPSDDGRLEQAARLGGQQAPDSAARVMALQLKTGLAPDLIARNLDTIEAEAKRLDFNAERFRQTSPLVAQWLAEHPTHYALAQDDLDNLSGLEGMVRALTRGFRAGQAQTRAARLAHRRLLAGGVLSAQEEAALERLERESQGPTGGNLVESIAKNTGLAVGQALEAADAPVRYATLGAASGGTVGALGAGFGAVPGFLAGAGLGATYGTFKSTSEIEAGHLYLELGRIRGENGETIDEATRRNVALAFGAGNGLLETVSFGVLGKPVAGVARQVAQRYFRQAARDALVRPTTRAAMARFGRAYAAGMAAEVSTEVAQELNSVVGGEFAKFVTHGQFETLMNSPEQRADLMDRLAGIAEQTAQGMFLLAGLPGGARLASDMVQVRRAEQRSEAWLAFLQRAGESKTMQRQPEAMGQVLEQVATGAGLGSVYLDPEPFVEYFQSQGKDPRQAAEELWGSAQAFDQALVSGAPMALPASRFATIAGRSTDHEFFAREVRLAPDQLNAREAEQVRKELEAAAQESSTEQTEGAPDLEQTLTERITATGRYREQDAALMAQQIAAFLRTTGERIGSTPEALLQRYGLSFGTGEAQQPVTVPGPTPEAAAERKSEREAMAEEFAWAVARADRDAALRTGAGEYAYARTKAGKLRPKLEQVATEGLVDELLALLESNGADEGSAALQLRQDENFHSTEDGGTIQVATEGSMRARGRQTSREKSIAKLDAELKRRGLSDAEVGALMLRISLATQQDEGFDLFQGGTATLTEHQRFALPLAPGEETQMHRLTIQTSAGPVVIDAVEHGAGQPLEIANIYLDDAAPQNRLGVGVMREVGAILRSEFPDARGVQGTRVTGASVRAGVRGRTAEYFQSAPVTGSPAFKRWFGDSKVVDENGEPLVVYHGTNQDFTTFRDDKIAWVALDPRKASQYAEGRGTGSPNVMPVYVRAENPLRVAKDLNEKATWQEFVAMIGLDIPRPDALAYRDAYDALYPDHPQQSYIYEYIRYYPTVIAAIQAAGYDSISAKERGVETFGVFAPEQIKSATGNRGTFDPDNPNIVYQRAADGPRGRMRRNLDTGQISIDIFDSANLSTVIHESWHFYLEVLRDVSGENEALAADAKTLLGFLGVERFDQIGREQHEKLARAGEAYFMEGYAPSIALRRAFHRFKLWLMAIYRNAEALDVELTPEIRGVFDRLFATEAEIDAARNEAQAVPLFTSPEQSGMTAEAWAAYRQTVEDAHIQSADRVRTRVMREWKREREAWWAEERAGIEAQVREELDIQPVYQALSVLRYGRTLDGEVLETPVKLLKADIVERKGADFLKALPRSIYRVEDGVPIEAVAEQFGFDSGDALLSAMVAATPYEQALAAETDRRMREKHGDMMADGTIADVAEQAVMDEARDKIIRAELRALNAKIREVRPFVQAEKAGQQRQQREGRQLLSAVPDAETLKAMAEATIRSLPIRDIRPHTYWVTARRSAKAALDATAKQDWVAAANARQAELMNLALYREAQRALDHADSIVAHARSLGQKPAQQRIGKAGHDYLEQINKLLERFDFRPMSLAAIDRRQALAAWIAQQKEAGITVSIPEDLQNDAWRQPWKTLTPDELTGLSDTLKHLEHLARTKNRLLKAQDERTLAEAIEAVDTSIREHAQGTNPRDAETGLQNRTLASRVGRYIASHRKFANLARVMDGLADGGAVWQYLVRPLNAAGDEKARLTAEMTEGIRAVFDRHYSKADWLGMYRKELTGVKNLSLSKMGRLVIALNAGTEDNRAKLIAGLNVTFTGKTFTESDLDALIDTLDARDMAFVQDVWDFLDTYWPAMKALAERLDGVAPEKIDARPLQTRHGEFRGGYYPIAHDPVQSNVAEQHQVMQAATELRGATTRASTKAGSRNSRVANVKRPLRLDFGVIFGHLEDVAMDLAYTEALYDVNRILRSDEIGGAIRDHYGDQTYRAMKDALDAIARGDEPARTGAEQFFAHLRSGVSIATMGWSLMTAAIQPLGLAQSIVRIGPKYVGRGILQWAKGAAHMEGTVAWIQERSTFMRMRSQTQFRELAEVRNTIGMTSSRAGLFTDKMIADLTAQKLDLKDVEDSFFWLITRMQLVADVPTWLGAYNKALETGADEATAVALADQAVLDSQGGGQIKDMAAVQRGSPIFKIWTTFYGYFNVTLNLLLDSYERTDFKRPASVGRFAVDVLMLTVIPATLTYMLREALRGNDPTDDEDFERKLLGETLSAFLGLFVGLREMSGFAAGFADYTGPAGARFFAEMGRFTKQVGQGEADQALIRAGNQAAGILFHYPALQVQRTTEGIMALASGRTRNPGVLLFGPPRETRR